jgi:AcrB/AcrD/AcrF family
VRAEGKHSVLLTIIKNGDASTLDVVNRVKAALPEIQKAAPPGMDIHMLFDQSVFVQNAIWLLGGTPLLCINYNSTLAGYTAMFPQIKTQVIATTSTPPYRWQIRGPQ